MSKNPFLTRLGETGAGAFTIMRIAGHSSVTVSQWYAYPTSGTVEPAFERTERIGPRALDAPNGSNQVHFLIQERFWVSRYRRKLLILTTGL